MNNFFDTRRVSKKESAKTSDLFFSAEQKKYAESQKAIKAKIKTQASALDLSILDQVHSDEFSRSIILEAERLIEMINQGLTYGRLNDRQRKVVYMYFFITNPLVNRILNLKTNLPLSKMTIQKPKIENDIVQDYIFKFYETMLKNIRWQRAIKKAVMYYFIFSEAQVIIEDDFPYEMDVDVEDEDVLREKIQLVKEEDIEDIREITSKYKEGLFVTRGEIDFVLKKFILNYNPNYKGIRRLRVVNPFDIKEMITNYETEYNSYSLTKSEYITRYLSSSENQSILSSFNDENFDFKRVKSYGEDDPRRKAVKDLQSAGYSLSYIEKNIKAISDNIEIDNDPYSIEGTYIAELKSEDICGSWVSMLDPLILDLIKYFNATRKENEKVVLANRKVSIVTAEGVSDGQLLDLQSRLLDAADNLEGSIVVINYPTTVESVDFTIRDQLDDVTTIKDAAKDNIIIGTGIPDTLINGADSYGTGFLKIEVLNEEFLTFREDITRFIEDKIFKPIALKKGFITTDKFENIIPIYPKLNFESGAIINKDGFLETLQAMADSKTVSKDRLLTYLGMDPDEVRQELKKQKKLEEDMGLLDMGGEPGGML